MKVGPAPWVWRAFVVFAVAAVLLIGGVVIGIVASDHGRIGRLEDARCGKALQRATDDALAYLEGHGLPLSIFAEDRRRLEEC